MPEPAERTAGAAVRVASLLPAGTEIVATLGGLDRLVGISHECDFPPTVLGLPRLTWSPIDGDASSAAIDEQVRRLRIEGRPVIATDGQALRRAAPDLIITQNLCDVCAVIDGDVRALAEALERPPRLLPLNGRTITGVFADILAVGAAIGKEPDAAALVATLATRVDNLRRLPLPGGRRRRVVAVEWVSPLFLAGHWTPELIEAAGGEDVGARPGDHSVVRQWSEIAALAPEIVVVMLCGFGIDRARAEWAGFLATPEGAVARGLRAAVHFIDGNAFTSRPGPRLVEGAEQIARFIRM